MGKSNSCLKIIACGSDTAAEKDEDIQTCSEAKGEGDKRRWSFRKKSARHRVLNNSVVSNARTSGNKESPQAVNLSYQDRDTPESEKFASLQKPDEKPQLPISVESKVSDEKPQLATSFESKIADEKPLLPTSVESKASDQKPQVPILVESEVSDEKLQLPISTESKLSYEKDQLQRSVEATNVSDESPQIPSNVDTKISIEESLVEAEEEKPHTSYSNESDESHEKSKLQTSSEPKMMDEKPVLRVSDEPKTTELLASSRIVSDASVLLDESNAIMIQASVRTDLAQRELAKLKSVVKLQAYARRHLVRMHAAETLHCIRAIVKVQRVVRAHQSKPSGEGSSTTKSASMSTENLLRNGFARQLLESTPKPKSFTIKCDPSRPNSAWNWLERWMSASSSDVNELNKQEIDADMEEIKPVATKTEGISAEAVAAFLDSESNVTEAINSTEHDAVKGDASTFEFQSIHQLLAQKGMEQAFAKYNDGPEELISAGMEKPDQMAEMKKECSDLSETPIVESELLKRSSKRLASEVLDSQGRRGLSVRQNRSRNLSDPTFVAAKSKFQDLTSVAHPGRSVDVSRDDSGVESRIDTASSAAEVDTNSRELSPASPSNAENIRETKDPSPDPIDLATNENAFKTEELSPAETSASYDPKVHIAGSECGTELSISSTLDSPDRSEAVELDCEVRHLEERGVDSIKNKRSGSKTNGPCASNIPSHLSVMPEEFHESNGKLDATAAALDSPVVKENTEEAASNGKCDGDHVEPVAATEASHLEQKLEKRSTGIVSHGNHVAELQETVLESERGASDAKIEQSPRPEPHTYKSSPVGTPGNHITVSESQGTPASQVSVKARRSKPDKSGSKAKHSSFSGSKKSPSHSNHDSGVRNSMENDRKVGKRRNSFGSTKSENIDQEPRDSSSSSKTLPSYMQATESARAKANSPRSSADVQDKDLYTKKRHSLPGASGRQDSPRIQRSSSQTPESAKGNEKKWQR